MFQTIKKAVFLWLSFEYSMGMKKWEFLLVIFINFRMFIPESEEQFSYNRELIPSSQKNG